MPTLVVPLLDNVLVLTNGVHAESTRADATPRAQPKIFVDRA
jgi:hypothetical protein